MHSTSLIPLTHGSRFRFFDIESAVSLISDPHAWLRPIYARLRTHSAFDQFAPAHQFAQLCDAVSVDHPSQAAQMREWSVGAQEALLRHLATSIEQTPPSVVTELARLRTFASLTLHHRHRGHTTAMGPVTWTSPGCTKAYGFSVGCARSAC